MAEDDSNWLTPKEAAAFLGVNIRSIYSWVGQGTLESSRDKRSVRVSRASLETLQLRKSTQRVVSEVVSELQPRRSSGQGSVQRKSEVTSAVFVALAGVQAERQQLLKQVNDLQMKAAKDAYLLGQLDEKLTLLSEMEEIITYLRKEVSRLQESHKRALNLATVLGIAVILLVFVVLVGALVLVKF